jgi:hypothetical protein
VRTVLDRLGDPEEIVAEAAGPVEKRSRRGTLEWVAIILLLVGGFLLLIGWIAGVALLWSSRAWTVKDKLIGTFLVPGGLALSSALLAVGLFSAAQVCTTGVTGPGGASRHQVCHGGNSTGVNILLLAGLVASVILPVMTAVYLARRADRPRARAFA